MVRTDMFLLLGNLLIVCVCPFITADECQGCNISSECCWKHLNDSSCNTVNASVVQLNSSTNPISENDNITLTCYTNIPDLNVTYSWSKDGSYFGSSRSYVLDDVLPPNKGLYTCCVMTACGSCTGSFTLSYTTNYVIILIVCGAAAISLIIIVGVAMKIKLKKENTKHKERMRQRNEQNAQRGY